MIDDTLKQMEARLQQAEAIKPENREELMALLGTLKGEIAELSRTHADEAASIAGYAAVSAHEATRGEKNPELLDHSLKGLEASVDGFKQSHPRLVQIVNSVCTALSNLGI